jgi:hypothetical protein
MEEMDIIYALAAADRIIRTIATQLVKLTVFFLKKQS